MSRTAGSPTSVQALPWRTLSALRSALPAGDTLPVEAWRRRHRWMLRLLWLHALGLPLLGLAEGQYDELLNFESSDAYTERQKAALAYAEAIAWHLDTDDAFWARMHEHFTEPELVELGCMIGLTLGQQSWLRMLNIDHHQVMAGSDASMAPGFETAEALAASRASDEYWVKS